MVWITSPTAESLISRMLRNSRVRRSALAASDAERATGGSAVRAAARAAELECFTTRARRSASLQTRRCCRLACQHRKHPFEGRGSVMSQHGNAPVALRIDPVELDHATRAGKRLVSMPGIIGAPERDERALRRRHLRHHVFEVFAVAEQAQASARGFPARVHVDQHGDDLALRVRVDLAVPRIAAAAHGDSRGPAFQLDAEFFLESLAKFLALEL